MPYIKNDGRREALRIGDVAQSAGELNFQIFAYIKYCIVYNYKISQQQVKDYVDAFLGDKPNYQRWNDMTGALVRCKKEIKRRLNIDLYWMTYLMESYDKEIDKYEDLKIIENGEVEV